MILKNGFTETFFENVLNGTDVLNNVDNDVADLIQESIS